MNTIRSILRFSLTLFCFFGISTQMNGQFLKKLGKAAEKAAERTVERRVEKETAEKTDEAMDGIFEPGAEGEDKGVRVPDDEGKSVPTVSGPKSDEVDNPNNSPSLEEEGENEVGFKTGNLVLYTDNFSQDAVGDFPAKWNTTLGGEVKNLKGFDSKFLKVPANSIINLDTNKPFPDNFTVELDLIIPEDAPIRMAVIGLGKAVPNKVDNLLTSKDYIRLYFSSRRDFNKDDALKYGTNNGSLGITDQKVGYTMILNQAIHVAFEVNGRRIRMFVDGEKKVDLPTAFAPEFSNAFFVGAPTHGNPESLQNYFYISNVVIAETGTDVRSSVMKDLIEKGNFTTNDILFTSGSDEIETSSKEILDQIGVAMKSNPDAKFMIIGHTDSDGETNANLVLSQKRAEAVKNYLVSNFGIGETNLRTNGSGESVPVADNTTADGKAQNRRVEFIKI